MDGQAVDLIMVMALTGNINPHRNPQHTLGLSGSSGKSRGLGQERDAGLTAWPVTAPSPPDEGVPRS